MLRPLFLLGELWNRQGDRILIGLLIGLAASWLIYYAFVVPNRVDTREVQTLTLDIQREVLPEVPFPEGRELAPTGAHQPVDVVLVLDVSGSMEDNDPSRLAMTAATMFIDLLPRDSRVAVILFSAGIAVETPLMDLGDSPAARQFSGVFDWPYNGGTNIDLALQQLRGTFANSPDTRRKVALFMTDAESPAIMDVRRTLQNDGITLFPIGFGSAVTPGVFSAMSYEPPRMVEDSEVLPATFAQILAQVRDSKPFPPERDRNRYSFAAGSDVVDVSVVLISEDAQTLEPRLFSPAGEIALSRATSGVGISRDERYIVIRLDESRVTEELDGIGQSDEPTWTLQIDGAVNEALVIPTYRIFIHALLGNFDSRTKQGAVERLSLVDQGGNVVVDSSASYQAVLDGPEGRYSHAIDRQIESGVYSGTVPFATPGRYRFFLRVETPTYTRDSEFLEFDYRENFRFRSLPSSPVVMGVVPQGSLPALVVEAADATVYNQRGDHYELSLSGGPERFSLRTNRIRLSSSQSNDIVVFDTDRAWPFISRGTHPGSHNASLLLKHASGSTATIPLELNLAPLPVLDYWMPAIAGAGILILTLILVVGRKKYTPFPRMLSVVPFEKRGLAWRQVRHPGNRWLFGYPIFHLPGAPGYEVVPRGRRGHRLILRHRAESSRKRESNRSSLIVGLSERGTAGADGWIEEEFSPGEMVRVAESIYFFGPYRTRKERKSVEQRLSRELERCRRFASGRLRGVELIR